MKKLFKLPKKVTVKRHAATVVNNPGKGFPTDTDTTTTTLTTTHL